MNEIPIPRKIPEKIGVQARGTIIQKAPARPQIQILRRRYGTKIQFARKATSKSRNQREASKIFP